MVDCTTNKTNIFSFIPKRISSELFIIWLLNFLDSTVNLQKFHQVIFDRLILKKEDVGREIKFISITPIENGISALLTFLFKDLDTIQRVLLVFGDDVGYMADQKKLHQYADIFTICYRRLYYKIGYINTLEEKILVSEKFGIIGIGMMESTLKYIGHLSLKIRDYQIYLQSEADKTNYFYEKVFLQHDKSVLMESDSRKYLLDTLLDNIAENIWNVNFE